MIDITDLEAEQTIISFQQFFQDRIFALSNAMSLNVRGTQRGIGGK